MRTVATLTASFIVLSTHALAAQSEGNGALALAARVGAESPKLGRAEKSELARFLNAGADTRPIAAGRSFKVAADKVQCRVSNVDVTEHDCTLTFAAKTVSLMGSEAQALYATLGDNGINSEGAAGSAYRSIVKLSCTIDPKAIEGKDGSGAQCTYASGP